MVPNRYVLATPIMSKVKNSIHFDPKIKLSDKVFDHHWILIVDFCYASLIMFVISKVSLSWGCLKRSCDCHNSCVYALKINHVCYFFNYQNVNFPQQLRFENNHYLRQNHAHRLQIWTGYFCLEHYRYFITFCVNTVPLKWNITIFFTRRTLTSIIRLLFIDLSSTNWSLCRKAFSFCCECSASFGKFLM